MEVTVQIIIQALSLGSFYALIAIGFALIFGVAHFFNLAHGDLIVLSGYMAYMVQSWTGFSLWTLMPLCALSSLAILPLLKFINDKTPEPKESNSLIVTFGLTLILQTIYLAFFSADYRIIFHNTSSYWLHIKDLYITTLQIALLGCSLAIICALYGLFRKTMVGKALRGTMQNREGVILVGISIKKMELLAMLLGCFAIGIAGPLYGSVSYLNPTAGLEPTLIALVITILAGRGRIRTILWAAWFLAFAETATSYIWGSQWREFLTSLLLIAILIFKPEGIPIKIKTDTP